MMIYDDVVIYDILKYDDWEYLTHVNDNPLRVMSDIKRREGWNPKLICVNAYMKW